MRSPVHVMPMTKKLAMVLLAVVLAIPGTALAVGSVHDVRITPSSPNPGDNIEVTWKWDHGNQWANVHALVVVSTQQTLRFAASAGQDVMIGDNCTTPGNPGTAEVNGTGCPMGAGYSVGEHSSTEAGTYTFTLPAGLMPGLTYYVIVAMRDHNIYLRTNNAQYDAEGYTAFTIPLPPPGIRITGIAESSTGTQGGLVLYSFDYYIVNTNNATITNDIPSNIIFTEAYDDGVESGGTITWSFGNITSPIRGTVSWLGSIKGSVADGTVIDNYANGNSTELGAVPSSNASVTIGPSLEITKSAQADNVNVGDEITYTVSYKNSGYALAEYVDFSDDADLSDWTSVSSDGVHGDWDIRTDWCDQGYLWGYGNYKWPKLIKNGPALKDAMYVTDLLVANGNPGDAVFIFNYADPDNFYMIVVEKDYGYVHFEVVENTVDHKFIGRIDYNLYQDKWYTLRVVVMGSSIKARLWEKGTPEPSEWLIEATENRVPGPGTAGYQANEKAAGHDNLKVFTPVPATNVVVRDTIPDNTTYVGSSNGGTYDPGTRVVTWNLGNIGYEEDELTVTVTADAGAANTIVLNRAHIDSDEPPPPVRSNEVAVAVGTVPASIGNYAWDDANQDGIQDDGESGLDGVTVNLYQEGGSSPASTTTTSSGTYSFTEVAPGSYFVEFVLPAGYVFSPKNRSSADRDSDADPASGRTETTTLGYGENDMTRDAGMYIPPETRHIVLDPSSSLSAKQGVGGLVTVRIRDTEGELVDDDASVLSLATSNSSLKFYGNEALSSQITTVTLVNGQGEFYVGSDTPLSSVVSVSARSPSSSIIYEPDSVNVTIVERPPWPGITRAKAHDPANYDQIPDALIIELDGKFQDEQSLVSVVINYKGNLDTVPAADVLQAGTLITVPMTATVPDYTPEGTVTLIIDVAGDEKTETHAFTDGIGPIITAAAILEQFGTDHAGDSLYITFSEPIDSPGGAGWCYNLYDDQTPVGVAVTVLHTHLADEENNVWLYVLERPQPVQAGMGLQLQSGAGVADDAGNTAHTGVHDTIEITLISKPAPVSDAWYIDGDGDGIVDTIFVRFARTIVDLSSISIGVTWGGDDGSPTGLACDETDSTMVMGDIKGAFAPPHIDITSGNMPLTIEYPAFGAVGYVTFETTERSSAVDSAAPVIVSALYSPSKAVGVGVEVLDTLTVVFSEPVDPIASTLPFHFVTSDGREYDIALRALASNGSEHKFLANFDLVGETNYPSSGDLIWINERASVSDSNGTTQLVENNKRVPIVVKERPYDLTYAVAPNPFTPGKSTRTQAGASIAGGTITITPQCKLNRVLDLDVQIVIFDAVGNMVAEYDGADKPQNNIEDVGVEASEQRVFYWNGLNRKGRTAGSGAYAAFLKITDIDGKQHTKTLMIGVKR